MDQFMSLSLLGDRQIMVVEPADDSCLKFLEPMFTSARLANFVIMQADALGKTSKLRSACEASPLCACLALYEEDDAKLKARLANTLAGHGLAWGQDAEEVFFSVVGHDRSVAGAELEKLALYCHGQVEITAEHVSAICGDTAEFGIDELIDAVLAAKLADVDRMFTSMGSEARSIFPLFQVHVNRLQALRMDMDRGMTADVAVRNAKPPIFFKRKSAMINQLRFLKLHDLVLIQEHIQPANFQSRKFADLAEAINLRTLLTIARPCQAKL